MAASVACAVALNNGEMRSLPSMRNVLTLSLDHVFALAVLKLHSGDASGAIKELREIVSKSAFGPAYETLAGLLSEIDLPTEARSYIDRALSVDPESVLGHLELARLYALQGQWDEVDLAMERLRITPVGKRDGHASRVRFAFWRGAFDLAEHEANSQGSIGPVNQDVLKLIATSEPINREAASAAFLRDASTGSMRRGALMHQLEAEVASFKNDPEWAIAAIERALEMGLFDIAWLRKCPLLGAVRSAPAYAEIERIVAARADELVGLYQNR